MIKSLSDVLSFFKVNSASFPLKVTSPFPIDNFFVFFLAACDAMERLLMTRFEWNSCQTKKFLLFLAVRKEEVRVRMCVCERHSCRGAYFRVGHYACLKSCGWN